MNLYFIQGSDNNGDSMSLFVRAATPQEAFDMWIVHDVSAGWSLCFESVLSSEAADDATVEDLRIFHVPHDHPPGPIDWHMPAGVNVVAHVNPI